MSFNNVVRLSVGVRIVIVILGMGLMFFRGLKSVEAIKGPVIEIPMIEAAAVGQPDRVKKLLKNGDTVNIVDKDGNSPLAFALWNGTYPANQEVIELLLYNQADVRCRNKAGQAVVQQVVKVDFQELRMRLIGKLIKFGAILDDRDNQGFTILEKTLATYDTIITGMMLDWWGRFISPTMLQRAKERADQWNLRDIRVVLDKGVKRIVQDAHWEPDKMDLRTGLNDLHCAVMNNDKKMVEAIVARRGDVNKASKDEYGMRPLHYAVLHYHPEMVQYLIESGAQVNAANLYKNSPLHMTAWLKNPAVAHEIADILLKNGAQLNAQNKDGNTLLHILIYNNNRSLINHIGKQYVFDMNIKNNDRETPAQLAERLQRKDILDIAYLKK